MSSFQGDFIKKDNKIIFKVKDVDVSILNAIRRVILAEIENVAFEFKPFNTGDEQKLKVLLNTCPLHNEIIQQRLSMLPINLTVNEILDFDENNYKFVINKKNETNTLMNVTTDDIEIFDNNNKKYDDKFTKRVFPKNKYSGDHILITKLKPNLINTKDGNEINIEMTATKDKAQNYSGFGYVSQCVYYNIVDEKKSEKELKKRLDQFEKDNNPTKEEKESFVNDFNNLDRDRYFHKNDFDEPNYFEYMIESECLTSPEYLFYKAITILDNKLQNVISKITDDTFTFEYVENSKNMYDIKIENEKHTLGNLIQALFYNIFIRKDNKEVVEYIGYTCPHPLDNNMLIKIKFKKDEPNENIKKIFIDGLEDIQVELNTLKKKWLKFAGLSSKYSNDIN
jgi:DNA-directed RNA polymerase I and III subunit RPAC1